MRKYFHLALFSLFILSSCNNSKNNQNTESTTDSIAVTKTELPDNFYKRLEGTVAGKPVVVNLQKVNGEVDGNYFYGGSWLNLSTDTSIGTDSLVLFENSFYDYYFDKDAKQNRLALKWIGNGFKGMWLDGKGSKNFPILLTEKYPEGSYKFTTNAYADSIKAFADKEKSPMATIDFEYLEVTEKDENSKWIDDQLKRISGINLATTDRQTGLKKIASDYLADYRKEIADQQKTGPDRGFEQWMNYSSNSQQSVSYNQNGYVVIDFLADAYTGGAHGNYGSTMFCFDVKNKKQMVLSDVVKIDSNTLQSLLEKNLRKQYNIKTQDKISSVLFDDFLKPNKNFYFNKNGLAFMYNPYEVASYAQGQIVVFIPFTELKPYLNPAFAERNGLK
ncbi:DUF3298 and DUF4163 domain-containing protein [Pedobacter sp. Leaf250]|uniref:DUF3298 and DUF4163 domain-containing protein n=1 Tax=Pedobacter sp. Leaf250 TaxID=2876559 RepID=UPI001E50EC9B|nr:DUF3298 and DUF4163 domain-containing protein [Pedobacter sp. Leaf250]